MLSFKEYIHHPGEVAIFFLMHFGFWLPDSIYLKILYRLRFGRRLDLRKPRSFSEKLQWLKLNDRRPEYSIMVDKFSVKEYVSKIIGPQYIIPTYGVWDNPEDIDWSSLPSSFVLKTTHGGGSVGVVVCKDKSCFDYKQAIHILKNGMRQNIYRFSKEWPYKRVKHRIIAEKYLEPDSETDDLLDYKFFCFNGEPMYCQVISGRNTEMCCDFFDNNWIHQPFHEPKNYPFANPQPKKPACFEQMWNASRSLSQGIPFLRIDFYQIKEKVYFGEITFFPTSGLGGFDPLKWDYLFGVYLSLPDKVDNV